MTFFDRFKQTRKDTEDICRSLEIEDYSVQPNPDVSPPKWHLAHSTWFYEQFVLKPFYEGYSVYNDDFAYLFNSYYNNAGDRVERPQRGLMTRPTVEDVIKYRMYVSQAVEELLQNKPTKELLTLIEVGINHEQQHQELLAYDIKFILGRQPTFPAIKNAPALKPVQKKNQWIPIKEGIYEIGYEGNDFHFDNERNRHKVYLQDFKIATELVSNADWLAFIEAGAYQDFNLWHAEGWDYIKKNKISAPLYWHKLLDEWKYYDSSGLNPIDPMLPVMHISYYEAFAYAEWKGCRLPTEFEWEASSDHFEWGQAWEWTASAYLPYPGFRKEPGALGEYNGKFMVSQHVLRGASIATASNHSRNTYRNFFYPSSRWLFSGLRLVK